MLEELDALCAKAYWNRLICCFFFVSSQRALGELGFSGLGLSSVASNSQRTISWLGRWDNFFCRKVKKKGVMVRGKQRAKLN